MTEIVLMHRQLTLKGERVEHLISLVPHESLMSTISRIKPKSGDEIVIKVLDDTIQPNITADKIMEDMHYSALEAQKLDILSPNHQPLDNLPF